MRLAVILGRIPARRGCPGFRDAVPRTGMHPCNRLGRRRLCAQHPSHLCQARQTNDETHRKPKPAQYTQPHQLVVCSTPESTASLPRCQSLWVLPRCGTHRKLLRCHWLATTSLVSSPRRRANLLGVVMPAGHKTNGVLLPHTTRSETSTFHAPSRAARRRCVEAHSTKDPAASPVAAPAAAAGVASVPRPVSFVYCVPSGWRNFA